MKKILLSTLCLAMTFTTLFAEESSLKPVNVYENFRESDSALINRFNQDDITKKYKDTSAVKTLNNILLDQNVNRCATKVVAAIKSRLKLKDDSDIKEAVLGLRLNDAIDDVAAGILIKASNIDSIVAHPLATNDLTAEDETKVLEILKKETVILKNKGVCLEDAYRTIINRLLEGSLKYKKNLKHINKLAVDNKILNEAMFKEFEKMRAQKVHEWPLTLSQYASNLENLAKRFPERKKDSSAVITNGGKIRKKTSLRQNLHEKFNSTQILLLANVVRDLKKRLDSKEILIHINYVDQESEIINLSPMEKFRFILKLLRKELALMNNGTILGGQKASYIDIITASYEVGYVSSIEIEQLASLEEIWNPKKTTKEKVMFWVKTFGGAASMFLPPPFGFVSVLAIMMIDQQLSEAPVDTDSDFNLL